MPSDRLLAKLAAKNKQTQQAPSNDGNTPPAEASNSKPLSNASSPPVHTNLKRTSAGQDTHNTQQTSSVKHLKIAAPPQPLPGETSDKVNPVIVEIEPNARWTAGVSPPMQALDVFDLPADADAYINESPTELLNRTRRHFGRFAADFVHVTKLFGLNNFEESYQKLIEENTVLKNVQQQSKTRIEQLQSEIASFEKQQQSWETDRLKLNTDNKRLSKDKSTLSSRVTELFSKLTALEAEHQQAANKITALEHELNQVKSELIQADEESINSLKEGYTACLDKFHAAGIDITGKTYQDYLNEITAKTSQTASNEIAPEIASNVAQAHLYTIIKQEDDEMLVPHQELVEVPHPVEGPPLVEGPQPMEVVAQTDSTNAADSQEVDEPQASRFTWMIENFSRLNTKKQYSDVFVVGGFKWRVLIFPKGNNVDHLSMYLDVADSSTLPYGWNRYAQFSLAVVNQIQPKYTLKKDTQHQFNARESDWGFTSFMSLSKLNDPNKGYLVNDTCIIEADVAVRKIVHFRSLEKPKEEDFCLELSKLHTYDDVVERVAQKLGLEDPSKIRLTPHNCFSQEPKSHPIKYRVAEHLLHMLVHYNQISDILYYEVLDIPLPELQCLKTLKVAFHHATKDEVVIHNIRLPKQSNVGDVLNEIKTKVELSHSNAELRLLEVFYHKIYTILPLNEKIENLDDQYWTLRAEEIPEEEKNLGPHDHLIHVYHFIKETSKMLVQNFGEPFFLVIHEGETLAVVKMRIQKKLQVPDEEFTKWKFAFVSLGRPEYLLDSDILSSCFQRRDVYGAWNQYLGLEHSDTTPKRAFKANQNRHVYEKPPSVLG